MQKADLSVFFLQFSKSGKTNVLIRPYDVPHGKTVTKTCILYPHLSTLPHKVLCGSSALQKILKMLNEILDAVGSKSFHT